MKTLAIIIATGFGSGYTPKAPGTAGAFVALILSLILLQCNINLDITHLILSIVFTFLGVWATNVMEEDWGHDPGKIVVDEMVGIWITFLLVPASIWVYVLGFVLFRVFDIIKPFGIRRVEKLPRGWGVMLDDVAAGIFANVTLQALLMANTYLQVF